MTTRTAAAATTTEAGGTTFLSRPFLLFPSHPSPPRQIRLWGVRLLPPVVVAAAAGLFTMAGDTGGKKRKFLLA